MGLQKSWVDHDRWDWFAAGDKTVAKTVAQSARGANSAKQILFEIGLTVAVPLALAALIGMAFAA
jgi:hypothetical protein